MDRITSRENQQVKRVCKLMKSKKERTASGFFVAEGAKLCAEAAASGIAIEELYITPEALRRYGAQLEPLCQSAGVTYEITEDIAGKIADTGTPQGVYCVCSTPALTLLESNLAPGRYIALESLQDPGNIGTILRTADAFAIDGVIMTADCPEVFSPKVLRATMGSALRVPVCVTADLPALLVRLNATHTTYAAALNSGARSIRACNFSGPVVVAIGNEGGGLSQGAISACKNSVMIDMVGRAESLNAGVAAAIVMWELSRR